jgi:hypothetical protein
MAFYILENFPIGGSCPDLDDWIRVRNPEPQIQEGKKDPQKSKKVEKFHALKCWKFSRAEDFSCCLDPDSGRIRRIRNSLLYCEVFRTQVKDQ